MIAYLILAHHQPGLLRRTVLKLQAPWARFFIHIDAKSDITPFLSALEDISGVMLIPKRIPVFWGGWSQVQATLHLIEAAKQSGTCFSHFKLMSGECYPLRDNESFYRFLNSGEYEYISVTQVSNIHAHKPFWRLERWHLEGGIRARGLKAKCIYAANQIAYYTLRRNVKKNLGNIVPYAGSQWWVLTAEAIDIIRHFVAEQPRIVNFYKHTFIPDESFFHTILANSHRAAFIHKSLTYVDWSDPNEQPACIRQRHIEELTAANFVATDEYGTCPVFFTRKFNQRNIDALDRIDVILKGATELGSARSGS